MTEIMDNNTEQLQEQQSQETETTADAEQAPAGKMFTQEEVNRIVGDRLERQRKQLESSINGRIANVEAREAEIQRYETENLRKEVAAEFNIPDGMVNRIRGNNRAEIRSDALKIAQSIGCYQGYPAANPNSLAFDADFAQAFAVGNKHVPKSY